MTVYVTFFSDGPGSEALLIDQLRDNLDSWVVWESKNEYWDAQLSMPTSIDGGVYSYGLAAAAAAAAAPDDIFENRIVSYRAPQSLVDLLKQLDSVMRAMRNADWPEWPGL